MRIPLAGRRPRYADIAATLALIIAMGGPAYATGATLPPDSVNTQAIQDGAVTTPKLANGAATRVKIANGAVSHAKLDVDSVDGTNIVDLGVQGADLATDSVTASKVAANSIDTDEIVDGGIFHADLASNTVDGSNVVSNSIALSDIVGTDVTGSISFSLGANHCGNLSLGVSGALVGQAVLLTYTGSTAIPTSVVIGPMRVVSSGSITLPACNVSSSSVSVSGLGVRVVTFG